MSNVPVPPARDRSNAAIVAPCRDLLRQIVAQQGEAPAKTRESAEILAAAAQALSAPRRNVVADERACNKVLHRIWEWNLARGASHVGPTTPGREATLWGRLCALFDAELSSAGGGLL